MELHQICYVMMMQYVLTLKMQIFIVLLILGYCFQILKFKAFSKLARMWETRCKFKISLECLSKRIEQIYSTYNPALISLIWLTTILGALMLAAVCLVLTNSLCQT